MGKTIIRFSCNLARTEFLRTTAITGAVCAADAWVHRRRGLGPLSAYALKLAGSQMTCFREVYS